MVFSTATQRPRFQRNASHRGNSCFTLNANSHSTTATDPLCLSHRLPHTSHHLPNASPSPTLNRHIHPHCLFILASPLPHRFPTPATTHNKHKCQPCQLTNSNRPTSSQHPTFEFKPILMSHTKHCRLTCTNQSNLKAFPSFKAFLQRPMQCSATHRSLSAAAHH